MEEWRYPKAAIMYLYEGRWCIGRPKKVGDCVQISYFVIGTGELPKSGWKETIIQEILVTRMTRKRTAVQSL